MTVSIKVKSFVAVVLASILLFTSNAYAQTESITYDAVGNMIRHTDFNGNTHQYSYDINDRVSHIQYADGSEERFTWDAVGNRLSAQIIDSQGTRTWAYEYDVRDRLKKETKPNGDTITYGYDPVGNKARMEVSGTSNYVETYQYDALNRLSNMTDRHGGISQFIYDPVSNLTEIEFPNGNRAEYTYNVRNRLVQKRVLSSDGTVLLGFAYTLNAVGQRAQIIENTGRTVTYTYDDIYRLTGETIANASDNRTSSYAYDSASNRTEYRLNGTITNFVYDANDRLTQYGNAIHTYDANGNTLTHSEGGNTTQYQYNSKNQLISVQQGGDTTTYRYDPDGIRYSKSQNGDTTIYLVDHNRIYSQVLAESQNGTEIVSYTYGNDLISQARGGNTHYYHYDGLGSTRGLSDETGAISDTWDYNADGQILDRTGATINHYLFTGEQYDEETGFYYLRARYMTPESGRFITRDTFEGFGINPISLNKYLYANANPVNLVDPTGFVSLPSVLSGIGVASTLLGVGITSFELTSFALNPTEEGAKNAAIGLGLAVLGGGGLKLAKILSSPARRFLKDRGVRTIGQLRGTQYEDYLKILLGGKGSFKKGGIEFDGAYGPNQNIWFEAKSGNFWRDIASTPKGLNDFKSKMGQRQKIAGDSGASLELFSNSPIPSAVKDFLTKRGIKYRETLD